MKRELIIALEEIILELFGDEDTEVEIEAPKEISHGDYTTNISLILAKKLQKKPQEIAEKIVEKFREHPLFLTLDSVDIAGPGFINFKLSREGLLATMNTITAKEEMYGMSDVRLGQIVMLEFADPNPFKEFHIGHLRNIILGESYARLMESQNADVWRVNYQGDVGMHVAKALFGMKHKEEQLQEIQSKGASVAERAQFLGQAYAFGAKEFEENEVAKIEIQNLNKQVYAHDPEVMVLWELGRAWSLEYFETIYRRVGTEYKHYYFESEMAEPGMEIVKSHVHDGIFKLDDGAIIYPGKDEGLQNTVFITSLDYPLYGPKDLALAQAKHKDVPYDKSIIITAHEQKDYFKVLLAAMGKVFPDLAKKTVHDSFGFVGLKEGKMSSRMGNVITGEWLLDEAKKRIQEAYPEMDEETAEKVALGSVKYSMLKVSKDSDMTFSFEESISLSGNSGPYLQYTYARTRSVLGDKVVSEEYEYDLSELHEEEENVLRFLVRFPDVVAEASGKFAPNLVANYLFELAQLFNLFYQKHKIIGSENEDFRMALTRSVGQVLKNGLYLLGIQAPQKM